MLSSVPAWALCLSLSASAVDGGRVLPASSVDGGTLSDAGVSGVRRINFKWDVPNVVSNVEIPGITWALGVPVKMQAVTSKGKIDDVMAYMYESFVRQGLYVEARLQLGPMLTGVDPESLITYTAIFQDNAPGFVTVVLGEADVLKAQPPKGKEFVPLFPGAQNPLRSHFEGVETLVYSVPDVSVEKVTAFYKDVMPKLGFQTVSGEGLAFRKGDERVSIHLTRRDGKVSVFSTRQGPSVAP